jgi:hypothetical protein
MLGETQGNGGKQRVKSLRSEFYFYFYLLSIWYGKGKRTGC